jgi:hypothetical protein
MALLLSRKGLQVTSTPGESYDAGGEKIVNLATPTASGEAATYDWVNTGLSGKIDSSEKGAASGVAPLNASSKIDSIYLPSSIVGALNYKGTWDASTTEYPATPVQGDYWVVSVAGTVSGHEYNPHDMIAYNGTSWDYIDNTDSVTSVNGQVGAVSLSTDDVSEGSTNKYYSSTLFNSDFSSKSTDDLTEGSTNLYYTDARVDSRFDTDFAAKSTDDLTEGSTNLYFTDARAKSAAVADSITDAVTDVAPSQNAVYDALALKVASSDLASTANGEGASLVGVEDSAGHFTGTNVETVLAEVAVTVEGHTTSISALQTDGAQHIDWDNAKAADDFAADTSFFVKVTYDASGLQIAKAQADSFADCEVVGFIDGATNGGYTAGDTVKFRYMHGKHTLGSSDSAFATTDIGKKVYLDQDTAGAFTLAPSSTAGKYIKEVGVVGTTDSIVLNSGLVIQA